ncbi:hypothetical protein [uncultured Pelagimonas sp.]|uniref:hypothetical protein n=1 Tax=uncultured Pelagimonas sp. TaxID=1618102 RepID=UPI0026233EC1|nr:hypothetical protein [uncultured Pelagimonas sp.]
MILRLIVAFFVAIPGYIWAENITVRGGEHEGFTRIVFDVPENTKWTMDHNEEENAYKLKLDANFDKFDLEKTFEKISKERVLAVIPTADLKGVDIELACSCTAKAFLLRNRMLVVDVSRREVAGISAAEDAGESVSHTEFPPAVSSEMTKLWFGEVPRIGPALTNSANSSFPRLSPAPQTSAQVSEFDLSDEHSQKGSVRHQVFGDLATAATIGLLDPSTSLAKPPVREVAEVDHHFEGGGLRTAIESDIVERSNPSGDRVSIGGQNCTPNDQLNISSWEQSNASFSLSLSTRRRAMFDEFDGVNKKAQVNYLRTLIFFGFGAEARSVTDIGESAVNPMYVALSYLIDGETDPTKFFEKEIGCETYASMWAVLDGGNLKKSSDLDADSVLQAFEALPKHLRLNLGPILAKNLTEAGRIQVAKSVLRRLKRANGGDTNGILYGSASIDLIEGEEDDASKVFQALSEVNGPETAESIARNIEISRLNGEPVSERLVSLSAAYSRELRNTEMGPELWQAHLQSLILNNNFSEAFIVLADVNGVDSNLLNVSIDETFDAVFKKSDDTTFLKSVFNELPQYEETVSENTLLFAAERLLKLGLSNETLGVLAKINTSDETRTGRILKARALLSQNKPREAEILLIGLEGKDVTTLRAISRSRMGDHEYSRELYEEMGESDDEIEQAWLASNWDRLETEGPENPFSVVAQLITNHDTLEQAETLVLSDIAKLNTESSSFRESISQVLNSTRVSGDDSR